MGAALGLAHDLRQRLHLLRPLRWLQAHGLREQKRPSQRLGVGQDLSLGATESSGFQEGLDAGVL